MQNTLLRKGIVFSIVVLFFGMSIVSSTGIFIEKFNHIRFKERSSLFDLSESRCYSHLNTGGSQYFFWFDPEDPGTFHYIKNISFPSSAYIYGSTFVEDEWWVCESNGHLWILDTETAEAEYIGHSGFSELIGLAYHEVSGVLYGMSINKLYTINMTTGKATLVGNMKNSEIMISLDCDINGTMYAYELNQTNGKFYSIDLETGEASFIGYTGVPLYYAQDMSYDLDEEKMYACIFNLDTYQGEFHNINLETGEFLYIGKLKDGVSLTNLAISYTVINKPPNPPIIDGPTCGKVGEPYIYTFNSTDDDGDNLSYFIQWGDGTDSGWLGPYPSGIEISLGHTWKERDSFIIKAAARDQNAISGWAYLEITMPKSNNPIWWLYGLLDRFPLLSRLLEWLIW